MDLVDSIGTCVFQSFRDKLSSPKNLSYELPKIGAFHLRFRNYLSYVLSFARKINSGEQKYIDMRDNNLELFFTTKHIYKQMMDFKEDKLKKRTQRYAEIQQASKGKL